MSSAEMSTKKRKRDALATGDNRPPRCADEDCPICDGSLWKEMCPEEAPQQTSGVHKFNRALALPMLHKPATAWDPVTDAQLRGRALDLHMLPCGDPIFLFEHACPKEEEEKKGLPTVWVHEMELLEEE